jgi:uncharacterized membrane protein HdeD (DUF308 family)
MNVVVRNWWVLVLRGVLGLLFGVFAILLPAAALAALVLTFGAYALVDGLFTIVATVRDRRGERGWGWLLLSGVAGVLAGVAAFVAPALTALVLLYVIAAWAVVTGLLEILTAVRLRREITGEWLLAASGALSIVFGALVMIVPMAGALAVVLLIGVYALTAGAVLIALGVRLRRALRRGHPAGEMERAA